MWGKGGGGGKNDIFLHKILFFSSSPSSEAIYTKRYDEEVSTPIYLSKT